MDPARPLVTFYVMTYNQARFVREAVAAALAQTYSPLEILVSDDCSTDDTFSVVLDTVKGYAGPHKVVLNRNPHNLGVSGHVNKIVELAHGELIIAADGDDVSHPERAARFVEAWLREGKPAAIVSSIACIDAAGTVSKTRNAANWMAQFLPLKDEHRTASLIRFATEGSPRLISCSGAWTKKMYEAFGPMPDGVWYEDDVITLRAWLIDRIAFMSDVLVNYREHDTNIFNRVQLPLTTVEARREAEQLTRTQAKRRRESLLAYLPDLDRALQKGWIAQETHKAVRLRVETRCEFFQVVEDWWRVNWVSRALSLAFLVRHGGPADWRWGAARLLPYRLFLSLAALWARVRKKKG